jgi:hypothetical protein
MSPQNVMSPSIYGNNYHSVCKPIEITFFLTVHIVLEPKQCNQVPSLILSRWRTLTLLEVYRGWEISYFKLKKKIKNSFTVITLKLVLLSKKVPYV